MAEEPLEPVGPPPEESQNRTFVLLALGLGGLFVVALIFIALYAFLIGPALNKNSPRNQTATAIVAANLAAEQGQTATAAAGANAAAAQALTATAAAGATSTPIGLAGATSTPLIPPTVTNTLPPTITQPATSTPLALPGTATATPAPLRTRTPTPSQVGGTGGGAGVRTPTPPVALPTTGFADEVGVPGLILLGLGLIAVVVVARRLRLSRG